VSAHGLRNALDPAVWRLRGEARPLLQRGALVALPVGVAAFLELQFDARTAGGIATGALLAGFVAFDAPARTRAIWQAAFAPVVGASAALGVLSAEPAILAVVVMTVYATVGGYCVAVSPRLAVAAMTAVLGLLIAQGLLLDPDQAPLALLAGAGGASIQMVLSLAIWALWDRETESPGIPQRLRGARRALADNLTRASSSLRHALRWGFALGAAVAVYRFIDLQGHGYWVPLTVLFVLKPGADETWERVAMRAVGTVAGLLLATVIAEAFGASPIPVAIVLGLSAMFAYALLTLEYALFTTAITVFVVLLTDANGEDALQTADQRALATVLGLAIVALAIAVTTRRASA
jgi:uncharacterized membrane protein YccC